MAFVYLGKLESLANEVKEIKEAVNSRYLEIFGAERFRILDATVKRTLTGNSFFDSVDNFRGDTGVDLPCDTANKFVVATPQGFGLNIDGSVRERKIRTAPLFYISKAGFQASMTSKFTDRMVASYIHEFDHYILYALQKHPLYLANLYSLYELKHKRAELTNESSDKEKIETLMLAGCHDILKDSYEKGTRILDHLVLSSIGIQIPLTWRGIPKEYAPVAVIGKRMIVFPVSGDPFLKFDDKTAVEKLLCWEDSLKNIGNSEYVARLIDSVRKLKVSKVNIDQL